MDIENIREFIALAKRPNVTSVAKELGISKSALSRHIALMEEELDIPLFEHSGTGIQLSSQGADIFSDMCAVVASYEDMLGKLARVRQGAKSRLVISATLDNELVATALSTLYSDLSSRNEAFSMENVQPDYEKLPELLKSKQVDLVLDYLWTQNMAGDLGFSSIPIGKIPMVAIVNREHRLAGRDSISIEDLRGETLIRVRAHPREWCWAQIWNLCRDRGFVPEYKSAFGTQLTDLVTMASRLQREVLIISETYVGPAGFGSSPFVSVLPFSDEDAHYVQGVIYNPENNNFMLAEALRLIKNLLPGE